MCGGQLHARSTLPRPGGSRYALNTTLRESQIRAGALKKRKIDFLITANKMLLFLIIYF